MGTLASASMSARLRKISPDCNNLCVCETPFWSVYLRLANIEAVSGREKQLRSYSDVPSSTFSNSSETFVHSRKVP